MTADLPPIDSYVTVRGRVTAHENGKYFRLDAGTDGWFRHDDPAIVSVERPATPLAWGEPVQLNEEATGIYVGLDPDGTGIVVTDCTCAGNHGNASFDGWPFRYVSRPDGTPIDWDATRAAAKGGTP